MNSKSFCLVLTHTVRLLEASTCCQTHISFQKESRLSRFPLISRQTPK